ncbi:MAG: dTDP-4-dehydrorhamnose 3,5-epimerase [Gammaproteobacteria bacterium]
MNVIPSAIPDILIIEPRTFSDERGFFFESYQQERYQEIGIPLPFVQDNFSRSAQGVLRGLHYQLERPQGKLVGVTRGTVFDVAVDIRKGSPYFGKSVGVLLDDVHHRQLYIPPGFAHGFYVVSEVADFYYKCTDYYHTPSERGLLWNDPDLEITWPLVNKAAPILAAKDKAYPCLKNVVLGDLFHV